MIDSPLEEHFVPTNGIRLHVVQTGPSDGPLVILLHGFPEFWYGWRHQISYFTAAGYRLWIPDQRGYNLSDKPAGIASYRLDALADDILGLIDASGRPRVSVIGHDWGGAVAWWLAARHPERLERLVILNVPHPSVMLHQLWRNPRQLLRSWYIFFIQIPGLPEALARGGDWRLLTKALTSSSRPGTFTDADLDLYRRAWSQPGAFQSMLNWYRAVFRTPRSSSQPLRIRVPTLLIWGTQDVALGTELAPPSLELCDDGELVYLPEATHWVQHEEPTRVNELIVRFLINPRPARKPAAAHSS